MISYRETSILFFISLSSIHTTTSKYQAYTTMLIMYLYNTQQKGVFLKYTHMYDTTRKQFVTLCYIHVYT